MPMLLVVTATEKEMVAVRAGLGAWPAGVESLVCGVGPVRAALELGIAVGGRVRDVRAGDVRGVVNLGVAGVFDRTSEHVGRIAAVSRETWPEVGLRVGLDVDARALGFAQLERPEVWNAIELAPDEVAGRLGLRLGADWPRWPALTVAGVTADPDCAERMRGAYCARLENMEGFGLALACARLGVPFLEVRSVSNVVGRRDGWRLNDALAALGRAAATLFGAHA